MLPASTSLGEEMGGANLLVLDTEGFIGNAEVMLGWVL